MTTLKTATLVLMATLLLTTNVKAQNYNLTCDDYTWNEIPIKYTPDSFAKANATVILLLRKANEYRFNETTKKLELLLLYHTIIYVNDDKSVEDNNKLYFSSGETSDLLKVKARVINNGKVVYTANEKDFKEVEEKGQKFNMLAFEGLEKGFVIEYYSITKSNNFDLYDDDYFQQSAPIQNSEFYLIVPSHTDFRCKSYNGFAKINDTIVEKRHIYFGTTANIPAVDKEEKFSLINANKARVEYNYVYNRDTKQKMAKWPEIGRTFFDRVYFNYEKNVKEVDKILAKTNYQKGGSDLEKIFIIEDFLKTNISVNSEITDEETFSGTLKRKAATQYRFNQIMAMCYRKAGLPMELVLTCAKDYKRFDGDFDSWSFLRSIVFYMPTAKQFIDPSLPYKRIGTINSDYLGQDGLFIKTVEIGDVVSAIATVKNIPANDVAKSNDDEVYNITFNSEMNAIKLNYNRKMNGYAEQGLKSVYFVLDDKGKKEFIEGFVKGLAKDAKLENLKVENYNPSLLAQLNEPLHIIADLTAEHYVEPVSENKILLKVGEVIGQQSEMYQDKPRLNAIDITFTHSYNRQMVINIPAGYKVKGLDKLNMNYTYNNMQNKPAFGFVSSYKQEGEKIIISCVEYYNDINYPSAQFNDFKKVINAAADFNKITILFEK